MTVGISELKEQVAGSIITPEDAGYADAIHRWAANAEKKAAVVVQVTSPADVAAALAYAKKTGLEVAIAGGRHSVSGASSTEGGLVIDLCKMRNVRIDQENCRIIAQGGCQWEDVDREAAKYDLVTVGGTVNDTGIGGLTLGGGYGYLSGQYGMVIDNLRNVEIVLASGECVEANETENPDLFWAIRGGGCNFGIVTEFTYQAYHHPHPVYSGMLAFTPNHLEAIVNTFNTWYPAEGQNPKTCFMLACGSPPPMFQPTIACVIFYDGDEEEGRRIFKPFFDLGPVADMTNSHPYVVQNAMLNELMSPGSRRYLKATGLRHLTVPILTEIFNSYAQFRQHLGDISIQSVCLFEAFPRAKINSVSNTATAFTNRGDWFNITLVPTWGTSPEYDTYGKEWVHGLVGRIAQLEKESEGEDVGKDAEEGGAVVGVKGYFNGSMGDEKISLVYAGNYARLREVKRKYDPEFVFRKWFPIVPADS